MTTFHGPSPTTEPGIGALTFGGFLADLAGKYGDRPALVAAPSGGPRVEWSYLELRERAWDVAKALVTAGVGRGTRVGVLMGSRPEWVAAVWGAAIAGGVAVPFNTFAERPELDHLLRHSDAAVVLTETALLRHRFVDDILGLCPEAETSSPGRIRSAAYPFLRHVVAVGAAPVGAVQPWDAFVRTGAEVPDSVIEGIVRETDPAEDGIIIYSSGTTSLPKGVLHRHRGPMLQCWRHAQREQFTPGDRVYSALPYFWTAGFAAVLGATLASGACLVLAPYFEAADALRLIETERITIVQCLPNHAAEMRSHQEQAPRDLSTVRRDGHRFTGEPTPDGGARPANHAAYGSSETFTSATALPDDAPAEDRSSYGRLVAGTSMRVLDPATGKPLGPGQEGEIVLKGLTLMRGYVKAPPEATFDEDGYFHTGDLGWVDDRGLLYFTGRMTDVIKTSGANVAPLEVEKALVSHPDIHRAVVVGVPDSTAGELVVGCVVPRAGVALTEEPVRARLRGSLSSFKIPRRVLFFAEGDLPRTGSEKFNVPAVRELAAERLAAET